MQNRFGFLYGKTFMDNNDIDRWLAVNEFSDSILNAVEAGNPVNDVTVLMVCEGILNKNLNSDMIDGVSRELLSKGAEKLRNAIQDFKFKPNWIREKFPGVWQYVKYLASDKGYVIIPSQMGRFIQVLKYVDGIEYGDIIECDVDKNGSGYVEVCFEDLSLNGSAAMSEMFGRLRFCDSISITTHQESIGVRLSMHNIVMPRDEFYSRSRPKRAWILQWNQVLKSNTNEGDGNADGTEA